MITASLLRFTGGALGTIAYRLGIRRETTLRNLALAFPEKTERERNKIARGSYRNLGITFFEFVYLYFGTRRVISNALTVDNPEIAFNAEAEGHGVIVLSGHIANWEWIAIALGIQIDRRLRLIVKNQHSKRADRFLHDMRTRFGNTTVDAGDVRGIFGALSRKEFLAVLGDQAAPATSVRIPFFGVSVPTFEGVARLALRSKAPILFLHNQRTRRGYSCRFERIDYSDIDSSSPDAVRLLTERHTAVLERSIRRDPALWVWQHKRWKDASR